MKILALVYLVLLAGAWVYSWSEYPIMKMTTELAMDSIERDFLRDDLSEEERNSYDFYARWIEGNQSGVNRAWGHASSSLFYMLVGTLILNLFNLFAIIKERLNKRKHKAEQGGTHQSTTRSESKSK